MISQTHFVDKNVKALLITQPFTQIKNDFYAIYDSELNIKLSNDELEQISYWLLVK